MQYTIGCIFVGMFLVAGCDQESQIQAAPAPASPGPNGSEPNVSSGEPSLTSNELAVAAKIVKAKCQQCHDTGTRVGLMSSPGFLTTRQTLPERLQDATYRAKAQALREESPELYERSAPQIEAILAEPDPEARQALWIETYLRNPKFDDPRNKMLYVHLEAEELDIVVRYLMSLK